MSDKVFTLWMTGIPCSGKTTLAFGVKRLCDKIIVLGGDEQRKGINSDLGFSNDDRMENARRLAHISKFLNANGISVIVSTISPSDEIRRSANNIIGDYFKLCYINCEKSLCVERDVKGMYASKSNFTGKDSPYEIPIYADVVVNTSNKSIESCIELICNYITKL